MRTGRQRRGDEAEDLALDLLRRQGLELLARNYRCRLGELDLVVCDGALLVIVEVRRRTRADYVSAAESVGRRKQQRVQRAACHFLAHRPDLADQAARFDVIASDTAEAPRWIRDAFRAQPW